MVMIWSRVGKRWSRLPALPGYAGLLVRYPIIIQEMASPQKYNNSQGRSHHMKAFEMNTACFFLSTLDSSRESSWGILTYSRAGIGSLNLPFNKYMCSPVFSFVAILSTRIHFFSSRTYQWISIGTASPSSTTSLKYSLIVNLLGIDGTVTPATTVK